MNMNIQSILKVIVSTFALTLSIIQSTQAHNSSNNNHVNNNNHNNNINYCLNRQISFDPNSFQVEDESESIINFYNHQNNNGDDNKDNNGNNFDEYCEKLSYNDQTTTAVSSTTIMTNPVVFYHNNHSHNHYRHHSQSQHQQYQQYQPMNHQEHVSFMSYIQNVFENNIEDLVEFLNEEQEDDDDDDNDDYDDGQSSMLSNASIRKRMLVGSGYTNTAADFSNNNNNNYKRYNNHRQHHFNTKNKSSSSSFAFGRGFELDKVLSVRGGGGNVSSSSPIADEFVKRLIAAATVTALYEGLIGHILEFLKIAMQTATVGQGVTYYTLIKSITNEKGLLALWDGFIPWGVIQAVCKGGVFGLAHAIAKSYLKPFIDNGMMPAQVGLTLAGGIAGGFQGFVLSPLLLLKTRVMTNPVFREKMSLWKTTLLSLTIGFEVAKNEGLLALMKGADVFAWKRVFDWSTRYYFSDLFQSIMIKYGTGGINGVLSPGEKIIASLLSGYASTLLTLPLDVIVAKSQDAKKAGVKVSAWDTFMQDYKDGGLKGLYEANMMGFEARLLHVCLTTVVMQTGSPIMYDFLFGKNQS